MVAGGIATSPADIMNVYNIMSDRVDHEVLIER